MTFKKYWPAAFYFLALGSFSYYQYASTSHNPLQNDWKNPLSWLEKSETVAYQYSDLRTPASLPNYPMGGDCDGYPRIDIATAPGFCVGVIDNGEGLFKPRFSVELDNGDLVLTDMVSWDPNKGRIYHYKKQGSSYERSLLFSYKNILATDERSLVLDRPNQVIVGPDNLVYIGAATSVSRFNPKVEDPLSTLEVVIKNIPGLGLHNLKSLVFNNKRQLFVNVGSATNVCQKFGTLGKKMKSCPEVEDLTSGQGQIRMYQMLPNGKFDQKFTVYAKGLRNSVAMTYDPKADVIIQAENGRDEISRNNRALDENEFPHEEINIIEAGRHYGWPYCFDGNINNPEWTNINCKNYTAPYLLLPPHSAPLSLIKHSGQNFPAWYKNRILMSLHGYAQYGHRIVSFLRDEKGLPSGVPLSVVYDWKTEENKPGTPVGLFEMKDGSVLITEDNNRKLLRLYYNESEGDGRAVREIDGPHAEGKIDIQEESRKLKLEEVLRDKDAPAFAKFQARVIDRHCVMCHGGESAPGMQFKKYDYLGNEQKLIAAGKVQEIIGRVSANPDYRTMPPAGFSSQAEQDEAVALLLAWMKETIR